jgi:Heterokaryon incompatibility protein (HET)
MSDYLWIDALCIDQTNVDERAAQVLLMGDIYSSATRVIIWLGKLIPEVKDVIWLQERYLPIAEEGRFPAEEINADLLSFLGISSTRWFELWRAYGRVYSTYRWFSRAWVVQELILARDVLIRCGEETIDCEVLEQLTQRSIEIGCLCTSGSGMFTTSSGIDP